MEPMALPKGTDSQSGVSVARSGAVGSSGCSSAAWSSP